MTTQIGFHQTFTGTIRGIKIEQAGPRDNQWEEQVLVCEDDQYNIYKFKLRKEDVEKNVMPQLEKLAGELVNFKCGSSHRAWKDRVFTDHYYHGEIKKVSAQ